MLALQPRRVDCFARLRGGEDLVRESNVVEFLFGGAGFVFAFFPETHQFAAELGVAFSAAGELVFGCF